MIATEVLKRYEFFGGLTEGQLKSLAKIAEQKNYQAGQLIFEECEPSNKLYLLTEGNVDLSYRAIDEMHIYTAPPKEFYAGSVNPGEVFGISALIAPYNYNATTKASEPSQVIELDAAELRKLLEQDLVLAYNLTQQTVKVLMDRLIALRVQLAAS
jgi:CRP/FNR family transcriptional regulator, cyclic AMP receptor protein